jgi:hypothetical protein
MAKQELRDKPWAKREHSGHNKNKKAERYNQ